MDVISDCCQIHKPLNSPVYMTYYLLLLGKNCYLGWKPLHLNQGFLFQEFLANCIKKQAGISYAHLIAEP